MARLRSSRGTRTYRVRFRSPYLANGLIREKIAAATPVLEAWSSCWFRTSSIRRDRSLSFFPIVTRRIRSSVVSWTIVIRSN